MAGHHATAPDPADVCARLLRTHRPGRACEGGLHLGTRKIPAQHASRFPLGFPEAPKCESCGRARGFSWIRRRFRRGFVADSRGFSRILADSRGFGSGALRWNAQCARGSPGECLAMTVSARARLWPLVTPLMVIWGLVRACESTSAPVRARGSMLALVRADGRSRALVTQRGAPATCQRAHVPACNRPCAPVRVQAVVLTRALVSARESSRRRAIWTNSGAVQSQHRHDSELAVSQVFDS